jgi:hypothetical protein
MIRFGDAPTAYPTRQDTSSVAAVSLSDITCTETETLVSAWKKWRGWHAMPPYRAWREAQLGPFRAHASVARVIGDGSDYEFEFIGDDHVRAYGVNHEGRRVSDIAKISPRFARQLKASYDLVRISGQPHAFQGTVGAEHADARFVWFETVYMPLSENGVLGYILNAAMYRPRAGLA